MQVRVGLPDEMVVEVEPLRVRLDVQQRRGQRQDRPDHESRDASGQSGSGPTGRGEPWAILPCTFQRCLGGSRDRNPGAGCARPGRVRGARHAAIRGRRDRRHARGRARRPPHHGIPLRPAEGQRLRQRPGVVPRLGDRPRDPRVGRLLHPAGLPRLHPGLPVRTVGRRAHRAGHRRRRRPHQAAGDPVRRGARRSSCS